MNKVGRPATLGKDAENKTARFERIQVDFMESLRAVPSADGVSVITMSDVLRNIVEEARVTRSAGGPDGWRKKSESDQEWMALWDRRAFRAALWPA